MNNGCVCCTVRGDLIRVVEVDGAVLAASTRSWSRQPGWADPVPVAQTSNT